MLQKKKAEGRNQVLKSKQMKNGWVRQADFEKCLALRMDVTVEDAHTITRAFIEELKEWLMQGFRVKFRGFGSIGTKEKKGRTFYNTIKKEVITTKDARFIKFDQSRKFGEELNEGYKCLWQQEGTDGI